MAAGLWIVSELPDPPPDAADLAWRAVGVSITPVASATADDRIGELIYRAGFELESADPAFGGFSGLLVDEANAGTGNDGARLVAVSDKGSWWRAELRLDDAGTLVGLGGSEMAPVADFGGGPLRGRMRHDAEELARDAEGRLLVAFEGGHRIHAYERPGDRDPRRHSSPVAVGEAGDNEGMEAVTRLDDGRLLVFAENLRDDAGRGRAWIGGSDASWREIALELVDGYLPTAAATLPGGDVLLLTRYYNPAVGVRTRLESLARSDVERVAESGGNLAGDELARFAPPVPVDNFEAVDVLPRAGGAVIYLLSDDNFRDSQRTLLLQLELPAESGELDQRPPGG